MKRLFLIFIILMLLAVSRPLLGSESSVNINNHVSSSSNGPDSNVTSHTDVTVETDGQVTHYSSDEPNKSIHVESKNGVSKIEVDGKEVKGDETSISPSPKPSPSVTPEDDKSSTLRHDFLQKLIEQLLRPFKILLHLFSF